MSIWTKDEARVLDPEYYNHDTEEDILAWNDAIKQIAKDRISNMKFTIQGYIQDGNMFSDEIEFSDEDLMFTTRDILRNDPNLQELVEQQIRQNQPEIVEKYMEGNVD